MKTPQKIAAEARAAVESAERNALPFPMTAVAAACVEFMESTAAKLATMEAVSTEPEPEPAPAGTEATPTAAA